MRKEPRTMWALLKGSTPNHLHLRNRLGVLIALTLVVDLVGSVLTYLVEKDAPGSDIHSFFDAVFWTSSQLLTVSSSLSNPVTGAGMVLDLGIEFIGITIVTVLAGSFGSFLYRLSMERNPLPHHVTPENRDAVGAAAKADLQDAEAGAVKDAETPPVVDA